MARNVIGKRYEGRLFVLDGTLHLVTEVDTASDTARVSCRRNGQRECLTMSLTDIGKYLAAGGDISLDALNKPATKQRLEERSDGWFFDTRDGVQGPFSSEPDAAEALDAYILAAQSQTSPAGVAARH